MGKVRRYFGNLGEEVKDKEGLLKQKENEGEKKEKEEQVYVIDAPEKLARKMSRRWRKGKSGKVEKEAKHKSFSRGVFNSFTEKDEEIDDSEENADVKKTDAFFKSRGIPDPFPGEAPILGTTLKKYKQDGGRVRPEGIKIKFKQKEWMKKEEAYQFAVKQAARSELLLAEEAGYVEAEEGEETYKLTQREIVSATDITSGTKHFNLALPQYGPYSISYTRNGRYLLIGGRRGHVAAVDWLTKKLVCEMNVMESVHDVRWLHQETMFAVAQKDWVYMYDNQGIELHCIKKLDRVLRMEFLPYHFLLATSSDKGWLSWLDVSIGKLVTQFNTRQGPLGVMCQNPSNAVLCLGHAKGVVTMWTPNSSKAVAKVLCHPHPVRAVSVDNTGKYMATAGLDRSLKIWDLRNLKCMYAYKLGTTAGQLAFSQRGLLAAGIGNTVELYKDVTLELMDAPYLTHRLDGTCNALQFCSWEDVLGVGHARGFTSILAPGAGEPNIDALESNPYQSKKQRKEAEVKALLEKIQPELITMDPSQLGEVDTPTLKEKLEAKKKLMYVKAPTIDFEPRKRKKGRQGSANVALRKKGTKEERRRDHVKQAIKERDDLMKETEEKQNTQKAYNVLDRFKKKI